jgi:xylulokinase
MESIGYIVKRNIEVLADMGIEVSEIRSLGGGAKSPVWSQIKADILGKSLYTMDCAEAACLGAAILAGQAVGVFHSVSEACESMVHVKAQFDPDPANAKVYAERFADYKKLFADMAGMFAQSAGG